MIAIFKALISKFFSSFLQAFLSVLVGEFNKTVQDIVKNVGTNTDWSNEAKRNEAFTQIKNVLVADGKELGDSTINLAVEVALKIIKEAKT